MNHPMRTAVDALGLPSRGPRAGKRPVRSPLAWALLGALGVLSAAGAQAQTKYVIERIGLFGPGFVNPKNEATYSTAFGMNQAGQVSGSSHRARTNGSWDKLGTAWLYSDGVTKEIGLQGPDYNDPVTGFPSSQVTRYLAAPLTESGHVTGLSLRYNGPLYFQPWIHHKGVTRPVGPYSQGDPIHPMSSVTSQILAVNSKGQVAGLGTEDRPGGRTGNTTAWLDTEGRLEFMGLKGGDYLDSAGYAWHHVRHLNAEGQVAGTSMRWQGELQLGESVWLHSKGTTKRIDPSGAEYLQTGTGKSGAIAVRMNNAAEVLGESTLFAGSAAAGTACWIYRNGAAERIGLPKHGMSDKLLENCRSAGLNAAGQAIGQSSAFEVSAFLGQAWFYNKGKVKQIGLKAAHLNEPDADVQNVPLEINDKGQVIGYGVLKSTVERREAWFYWKNRINRIGLFGPAYPKRQNVPKSINANGQVVGSAYPLVANQSNEAWFYDFNSGLTYELVFSRRAHDGYSQTDIFDLSADGVVLGRYSHYVGDTFVGYRSFSWSIANGFQDLSLLTDSHQAPPWKSIDYLVKSNSRGEIAGSGSLKAQGAFILKPQP
jgi:hypothetical protein